MISSSSAQSRERLWAPRVLTEGIGSRSFGCNGCAGRPRDRPARTPCRLIRTAHCQSGHTPPAHTPVSPHPCAASLPVARTHILGRSRGCGSHWAGRTDRPVFHFRGAFRAWTQSVRTPIGSVNHRSAPLASPHCLVYPACFGLHGTGYNIWPGANQQRHNVRGSRIGCLMTCNRPKSYHYLSRATACATRSKLPDAIHQLLTISYFICFLVSRPVRIQSYR